MWAHNFLATSLNWNVFFIHSWNCVKMSSCNSCLPSPRRLEVACKSQQLRNKIQNLALLLHNFRDGTQNWHFLQRTLRMAAIYFLFIELKIRSIYIFASHIQMLLIPFSLHKWTFIGHIRIQLFYLYNPLPFHNWIAMLTRSFIPINLMHKFCWPGLKEFFLPMRIV